MTCGCTPEYCCPCGRCLPHEHERMHRISETLDIHKFYVDPRSTFVNPGWNETPHWTEGWFWYRPVPGRLIADCWRRA